MKSDSYDGYYFLDPRWLGMNPDTKRVLMVGRFGVHGGAAFEFGIKEFQWQDGRKVIRVDVFSDGFLAYWEYRYFFQWLSERKKNDTTMEDVLAWLRSIGFISTDEMTDKLNELGMGGT